MPATTRSAKQQATLEDVGAGRVDTVKSSATQQKAEITTASKKRKAANANSTAADAAIKKAKTSPTATADEAHESSDTILINRAPVLELWASCVTQVLYPTISWSTCLSAGGAISTITAISKGRSIGTIEKPDPGEAESKRQKRAEQSQKEDVTELEIMSFTLQLDKEGQAMVGGKPKKTGEEALIRKFSGAEVYDKAKKSFDEGLAAWKGRKDELNQRAFGMYEHFRPTIPPGQKGWGRKGQLNLETVKTAIKDG